MSARFGRAQKAAALVPLAALSAAWTISLTGLGAGSAEATGTQPSTLPDGTVIPAKAIDAPATVSAPDTGAGPDLSGGKAQQIVASADSAGIPAAALAAYQRAASVIDKADTACHLDWQLLAAIGRVESNHGRADGNTLNDKGIATPGIFGPELNGAGGTTAITDTDGGQYDGDTSYDRAVGPMQFIPSTWSVVGVDADGDGQRNPQDINDAALAAAVYLCSGSDDLSTTSGQRSAVYRYNHSDQYVSTVLGVAQAYLAGDFTSAPNFTVPAAFLTEAPATTAAKKHHHKTKQTTTTFPVTPVLPAPTTTPPPPEPTDKPSPTTKPTPTKKPTPGSDPASALTQPVQEVAASIAQLTQVCTQALVADGISNPATAVPKALQECVAQLTGKTLPQAEKAVTDVVTGLASLLQSLLGGVLGGLLGGGKS